MKYKYILYISLLGLIFACQPELDDFEPAQGNADFSVYVAVGNSLTAGYTDGSLYRSSQLNSFPSILAEQFKKAGGGNFVQPLLDGEYGILPGKLKLDYKTDCAGTTSVSPVSDQGTLDAIAPVGYTVNNLGVPGAKSFHLLAQGYGDFAGIQLGTANPYYARFASSSISTVVGDAIAQQPTFYTLWIGNNDVLGYAAGGGTGDTITGQATFTFMMNTIVQSLNATGAKGAIAGLPDMLKSPYFAFMSTQVPFNGLVLTRQGQVDSLNFAYQPLGITFSLGQNPFIVEDAVTHFPRQMKESDIFLLTLPTDSLKCEFMGSAIPIPHKYIIDETEANNIDTHIGIYNNVIQGLAAQYDLAYIDMFELMTELETGITRDGITLTTEFVSGNAFSLDGIHLTPMGYAHVANMFIDGINEKFNSNLPKVSLAQYPSVILP